jgi:hypothetical protein
MQDLTGKFPAALVPSSMSAGGEVHFDSGNLQMTAPGSQPVSAPAPEWPGQAAETMPLPVDSNGGAEDYARLVEADGARTTRPQQAEVDAAGNAGRWQTL